LTDIGQVMPLPKGESAQLLMVDTDGAERVIDAGAFDHFGQDISG
jgi:hypothetical protein